MQVSDLTTGQARLNTAMQTLGHIWNDSAEKWNDVARRQFEQQYIEPLPAVVRSALEAINRMSGVLTRMEQECQAQ
jgi:hypothetical protein